MAYSALTLEGIAFISGVCTNGGTKLLSGKKNYPLPYTQPLLDKVWSCNIMYNGKEITTGEQLAEALIYWFNYNAKNFNLDANVIAAQAYVESNYVMWNYEGKKSTASGISGFEMLEIFGVIVDNMGKPSTQPSLTSMSPSEIANITAGLTNSLVRNSYNVNSKTYQDAYTNRPILQQNIINNPQIMIKAQCMYMKDLANKCGSLTSTSLFCYSRGSVYVSDTYSKAIKKCQDSHVNDADYTTDGLNYVLKVFGVLGDKDNKISDKISGTYKKKGSYFGYDESKGKNDPKNLKLTQGFNAFDANVTESDEFGLKGYENDVVVKALSAEPKYKFIYFPETNYIRKATQKVQVVLHHTASGDNIASDIQWWERNSNHVATPFIVGRRGEIFQLFSTDYWAYHLGITSELLVQYNAGSVTNQMLNENSIGIEIDSWGGLVASGGYWYPAISPTVANTKATPIPIKDVIEYKGPQYPKGFHGYYAFERYTPEQINAVKTIITALSNKWTEIKKNLGYVNDIYSSDNVNMWGTYDIATNKWSAVHDAYIQKPGVWTHVSYIPSNSDCHPQPELIDMLKSLK